MQSLLEKLAEIENRRLSEVAQLDRKLGNASVRSNRTMVRCPPPSPGPSCTR